VKKVKLGSKAILFPMPPILVGAIVNGKPNYMTISWNGLAGYRPPTIAVAMREVRYTYKGIKENGTFSVNLPSSGMHKETDFCGIYSGNRKDKSRIFKTFYGKLETAPLIEECPLNHECKVVHSLNTGSHILIIGEIVETYINEDCLTNGKADGEKIDPLIYLTSTLRYHRLGDFIAKAFSIGRDQEDKRDNKTILAYVQGRDKSEY
jgi:flavin reductase (DIM6/NTAB) family NADH-FMN oxidoreductase RutF